MKISIPSVAGLALAASVSLLGADGPGNSAGARKNLFVGFKERPTPAQERMLEAHGARIRSVFANVNAIAIDLDEARIGDIARAQGVDYVEEDPMRYKLGLSDAQLVPALANGLYGLVNTKAINAHAAGITGVGVKVGVADTWLDPNHPDIASNLKGRIDTVGSTTGSAPGASDGETHATHVAGTILGVNNAVGVVGAAYGAQLYHARVLGPTGGTTTDIMEGVQWLADQGCQIINLSLGGGISSRTEENFYKSMRSSGVLVVAATGNDGRTRVSYPAAYPVNIAVGAVDVNNALASFSNTGKNIDVVAPGVAVLSSVPNDTGSEAGVTAGATSFRAFGLEFAGKTSPDYTGPLVNCGRGQTADFPIGQSGYVALIERGDIDFATKVGNAKNAGAGAAIIYNNVAGDFIGTLGAAGTWIPAVSVSQAAGTSLKAVLGSAVTVLNIVSDWDHYDGTSMATPHTAGVLALVLEARKLTTRSKTNADAAESFLKSTCLNLGPAGYDTTFGSGLVQAPTVKLP